MLVTDCIEHAEDIGRYRWLERALERGFCGFANMNEHELTEEARLRGLPAEVFTFSDDSEGESDDADLAQFVSLHSTGALKFDQL